MGHNQVGSPYSGAFSSAGMKFHVNDEVDGHGTSEDAVAGGSNSQPTSLLEGLPDAVAMHCLARVPLHFRPNLQAVSRAWRSAVHSPELFRTRKLAGIEEEWLYVSAYDPDGVWQAYDPCFDCWMTLPLLPSRIKHLTNYGTASVGGKLYVVGGGSDDVDPQTGDRNATMATNEVWSYDPILGKWEQRANMLTARSQFACCVLGDQIVVAGGFTNTRKSVASAEMYDPVENTWKPLAELGLVYNAACSGVVLEGKFHVVHKGVALGQLYNAEENRWVVADCEWSCGKMVVVKNELYVVRHGVVSREQKQPPLRKPLCSWPECLDRISFGVVGLGSDLFVIGGIMGPRVHMRDIVKLSDVDICNVGNENPIWRKGASMTASKGTILGCAIVKL